MSERLKILVITEIEPAPTTASGIILHRHFKELDAELVVIKGDDSIFKRARWISAILNRIAIFFPHLVEGYVQNFEPRILAKRTGRKMRSQKFDLVLTLAHGRIGLHAWRIGKYLKLPVVTFFHDWWPELYAQHSAGNLKNVRAVEQDFKNCQSNANICIAVCPGMKDYLVHAKKVEVLYPIPDKEIKPINKSSLKAPFLTVVYAGSLWSPYGAMLESLVKCAETETGIRFRIHGDEKYLPEEIRKSWKEKNILHGYVPEEQYVELITKEADVLLGVMGEDEAGCVRMKTSFPSKVANYFRSGNPVLLWAPESTSLGEFCRNNNYKLWVPSSDPAEVKNKLKYLAENRDSSTHLSERNKIAETLFSPDNLQRKFVKILETAKLG